MARTCNCQSPTCTICIWDHIQYFNNEFEYERDINWEYIARSLTSEFGTEAIHRQANDGGSTGRPTEFNLESTAEHAEFWVPAHVWVDHVSQPQADVGGPGGDNGRSDDNHGYCCSSCEALAQGQEKQEESITADVGDEQQCKQ